MTKIHFFCKFRTFPVTEGYAIWHSIFSPQPRQESSPTEQNSSTQEGTNFRHAMFLHYLEPEKCQNLPRKAQISDTPCFFATLSQRNAKTYPETARISDTPCFFATLSQQNAKNQPKNSRISYELHSLTPTTMPRKVLVFHNFTHCLKCIHEPPSTPTKKNNNLGTPNSMIPQLQTNCDTFGQ